MASRNIEPLRKPIKCPSCDNTSERETYPFCSKKCADLDLHRWVSQVYTIPAEEAEVVVDETSQH